MNLRFLSILALAAMLLLPTGCTETGALNPVTAETVTIGTSLAVDAYPAAAPFASMFANAVRAYTAKGPIPPEQLAVAFAPYITAAEKIVGKVSTNGAADIQKYSAAILAKYAVFYPKLQKGEMTIESFAQAVEKGA